MLIIETPEDLDFSQESLRVNEVLEKIQDFLYGDFLLSGEMHSLTDFSIASAADLFFYFVFLAYFPLFLLLEKLEGRPSGLPELVVAAFAQFFGLTFLGKSVSLSRKLSLQVEMPSYFPSEKLYCLLIYIKY